MACGHSVPFSQFLCLPSWPSSSPSESLPKGPPAPGPGTEVPPSLSLTLLPSLHFPNCACYGTSSVYSPGGPQTLHPHRSFLCFSPLSIVFKQTKLSSPFCGRHFSLSACFPLSSRPTFLTAFWTPPAGHPVNNQTQHVYTAAQAEATCQRPTHPEIRQRMLPAIGARCELGE